VAVVPTASGAPSGAPPHASAPAIGEVAIGAFGLRNTSQPWGLIDEVSAKACYRAALSASDRLAGWILFKVHVEAAGEVVVLEGTEVAGIPQELVDCTRRAMRQAVAPPWSNGDSGEIYVRFR